MKTKDFCLIFLILVAIFMTKETLHAATVGNPLDLDVPTGSSILRQRAIDDTLDEYEEAFKIKTSFDAEFILEKELKAPIEIEGAELEGHWYMAKIGATIFNRVEPYIKLGTSSLEVKWKQASESIEIDADDGFAWGGGIKAVLWDFDNWGIRLTADGQYRVADLDTDEIVLEGTAVNATGSDFDIKEWQASIALSKKFELPLRWQSIYVVPYTGVSASDSTVDVSFEHPDFATTDFSLFDASNDNVCGFFMGCDIMPSLISSFIYSVEVRLLSEVALSFGGTLKF